MTAVSTHGSHGLGPLSCIFPGVSHYSWREGAMTHICSQLVRHACLFTAPTPSYENSCKTWSFQSSEALGLFFFSCPSDRCSSNADSLPVSKALKWNKLGKCLVKVNVHRFLYNFSEPFICSFKMCLTKTVPFEVAELTFYSSWAILKMQVFKPQ